MPENHGSRFDIEKLLTSSSVGLREDRSLAVPPPQVKRIVKLLPDGDNRYVLQVTMPDARGVEAVDIRLGWQASAFLRSLPSEKERIALATHLADDIQALAAPLDSIRNTNEMAQLLAELRLARDRFLSGIGRALGRSFIRR